MILLDCPYQLEITNLEGNPLGVNCYQKTVFKKGHKHGLGSNVEGVEGFRCLFEFNRILLLLLLLMMLLLLLLLVRAPVAVAAAAPTSLGLALTVGATPVGVVPPGGVDPLLYSQLATFSPQVQELHARPIPPLLQL